MADSEVKLRVTSDSTQAVASMNKVSSSMAQMKSTWTSVSASWVTSAAKIAAALYGVQQAWNLAKDAADYREQMSYLNALGSAYGQTGNQIVEAIQKASTGLISMKDAAAVAMEGVAKGLSPQQLTNLASAAATLGDTVNEKPIEAFKNLAAAITDGRAKAVKHYAGIVDLEAKYGDLANKMSETEKSVARYNMVMDYAKKLQDQMGEATDSTADKMDRFAVTMEDAKLKASEFILKGVFLMAKGFYAAALALAEFNKEWNESPLGGAIKRGIFKFGERGRGGYGATGDFGETIDEQIEGYKKQIADLDALMNADLSGEGSKRKFGRFGDDITGKAGAAKELNDLANAQMNWKQAIESMNPALLEEDKALLRLNQQVEDLQRKWGDQGWIESGKKQGMEYIRIAQQMKTAEEEVASAIQMSESAQKVQEENLRKELDVKLMLIDVDAQRASMALDYDRKALDIGMRYGQISPGQGAASAFDMDVKRLENMRNQLSLQIQIKNELSTEFAPAEDILELSLKRKLVEEEINRLLGLRSAILREHTGTMGEGFSTGWNKYFDDMGSEFQRGESYARDTASAMHAAFEDFFFDPMNMSWDNLWKSMQRIAAKAMSDIAMDAIRTLGKAGINWLSGGTGAQPGYSIQPGVQYHNGGIVGEVPRLHNGLMPGEYPAILQKGEGVFTPAQMKALGGSKVTVNIINNSGAEVTTQSRDNKGTMELDVIIDRAVASKLGQFGSSSNKVMRQNFNTSQRLISR